MAKIVEELFMKIGSDFDPTGANQALQLLTSINDTASKIASTVFEKTVGAFASFEAELITVQKTTGMLDKDMKTFGRSLLDISNATGQSVEGLAKIAGVAGQLGVKKENLLGFTATVNEMSIALDLTADKAAEAGAKIANSFALSVDEKTIRRIGDTVNSLSDSTAAAAGPIINFLQQFGGTARQLNITLEQSAALGATLIATGQDASDAATRLSAAFREMIRIPEKSSDKAIAAAKTLGVTLDEYGKMINKDFVGTFSKVAEELGKIEDRQARLNQAVKIFGAVGARSALMFIGNLKKLEENTGIAIAKQKSMRDEFENVMKGIGQQMKRTETIFRNFGVMIGSVLGPPFGWVLGHVNDLLAGFSKLVADNPILLKVFAALALSVGVAATAIAGVTTALIAASQAYIAYQTVVQSGAIMAGLKSIATFTTMTFLPVMFKIAAVGAILFAGWKFTEAMAGILGLQDELKYLLDILNLLTEGFANFLGFGGGANTSLGSMAKRGDDFAKVLKELNQAKIAGDSAQVKKLREELKMLKSLESAEKNAGKAATGPSKTEKLLETIAKNTEDQAIIKNDKYYELMKKADKERKKLEKKLERNTKRTRTRRAAPTAASSTRSGGVNVTLRTDSNDPLVVAVVENLKAYVSGLKTCGDA